MEDPFALALCDILIKYSSTNMLIWWTCALVIELILT